MLALVLVALVGGQWRSRAATNRFVAVGGSDMGNDCTLQGNPCATIQHAINQSTSGDVILLGPGTYTENVTVGQNVTIQGAAAAGSTVNGGKQEVPVLSVPVGVTAALSTLTLTGGNGDDEGGGGINNQGTLTVTNTKITGNTAGGSGFGGGISNGGTLTVANSTISANSATIGGGISNLGKLTVTGTSINGNLATATGGGIMNERFATLSVTSSTINGNSGPGGGGGISNIGVATVTNSTISANSSDVDGGGIDNAGTRC
jgi:hypothetical protein